MHKNFIKHITVLLIIFSNYSFGKEFNELFTIYTPFENSNNINTSINKSFNNMVYRVSGSKSPSNIWKIINSGSKRKDFINSYSIKNFNKKSYLEVKFNRYAVIDKFKELSIPIIGDSRPVILFLIKIESGSQTPYYLSGDSNNTIDKYLIETLDEVSNERGIFLELPTFDLEDKSFLSNSSILLNSEEYLISKYQFDQHTSIKLTNLGINKWAFNGDIEGVVDGEKYFEDIKKMFVGHLESLIEESLKDLIIKTSTNFYIDISIEGIESYKDYLVAKEKLSKIASITSLDILNFKNNVIKYKVEVMGSSNTLINNLETNTFFEVLVYEPSKSVKLVLKND